MDRDDAAPIILGNRDDRTPIIVGGRMTIFIAPAGVDASPSWPEEVYDPDSGWKLLVPDAPPEGLA